MLCCAQVSFDLTARQANLSLPPAATGRLQLVLLASQTLRMGSVRVNGIASVDSLLRDRSSPKAVVLEGLSAGWHMITWDADEDMAIVAPPAYPPPRYKAAFLGRDDVTQGNWIGKYGSAGRLFFSPPPPAPPAPPGPPPTPAASAATCAVVSEAATNSSNMKPLVLSQPPTHTSCMLALVWHSARHSDY